MTHPFRMLLTLTLMTSSFGGQCSAWQELPPPKETETTESSVTFSRMAADVVQTEVMQWLRSTDAEPAVITQQSEIWSDTIALAGLSGEELLDRVIESFASVDPATKKLAVQSYGAGPVDPVILDGIRNAPFFRNQVQLYRARWLAQHRFFDDALPLLTEIEPDHVVDPAGLLFYRAICQSELLYRRDALDTLGLLLHNTLDVPARFRIIAEALHAELSARKDDGMSQVERLMKDVNRRLDQGRSGEKTQGQEIAVLDAIDKLMEELEEQQQQQSGAGGNGSQGQPGGQPAQQSQARNAQGATGEADRVQLTEKGKWGMMNQKAEAKARELIRQKFPPNFLDQIGRYTKKLAEQKK